MWDPTGSDAGKTGESSSGPGRAGSIRTTQQLQGQKTCGRMCTSRGGRGQRLERRGEEDGRLQLSVNRRDAAARRPPGLETVWGTGADAAGGGPWYVRDAHV